jgi:hypothetical protein
MRRVAADLHDAGSIEHQRPAVQCAGDVADEDRRHVNVGDDIEERDQVTCVRASERPKALDRRALQLDRDLRPPRPVLSDNVHGEVKAAGSDRRLRLLQ